jgi:hypothetical protein
MVRTGKILLAGVLALMAIASAGSAPASAAVTKICQNNPTPSPCLAANVYAAGTTFTSTGGSATLGGITSCTGGVLKFKIGTPGTGALPSEVLSLTFGTCSPVACTVTSFNRPWSMPIEVSSTGPSGTAKMHAVFVGGDPGLEVNNCGTELNCKYTAASIPEFITGGTTATFKSSGGILTHVTGSGSGCAASFSLSMVHELPGTGTGLGFFVTN